jgi:hypothetical protein
MSVTSDRLRERIHALRRSDPCPFTTHPGTTLPTGAVVRLEAGAGQLYLSPYTVRDHIKAILDRAGVNSRGELVGTLFSEHPLESMTENIAHPAVVAAPAP